MSKQKRILMILGLTAFLSAAPCVFSILNSDFISRADAAYQHPGGFHTIEQLDFTRGKVRAGIQPWASAYKKLLLEADKGLTRSPSARKDFNNPGAYVDREAWSRAREPLDEDASAAYVTALAYALNVNLSQAKRNQYGQKAIDLLNDWGHVNKYITGEDGPLNAAESGNLLIHAAELMWTSSLWNAKDKDQFKRWADNVLYKSACDTSSSRAYKLWPSVAPTDSRLWLINHNHGGWFITCALAIDHLTDNKNRMSQDIERLKIMLDIQILPDGSMPNEIARGEHGRYYMFFALKALTGAVEIARNVGTNLYHWLPPSGGSLKDALDFYWRHAVVEPDTWPCCITEETFQPDAAEDGGIFFDPMGRIYDEPAWTDWTADYVIFSGGGNTSWVIPTLMQPVSLPDRS